MVSTAIVGGGLSGLVLALRLAERGLAVTLFERRAHLGGGCARASFGSFAWDRRPMQIEADDDATLRLIAELGLADRVVWRRPSFGIVAGDRIHRIGESALLIKSPLLGPLAVRRLARAVERAAGRESRDATPDTNRLRSACGDASWDAVCRPILEARLGAGAGAIDEKTAAAILLSRLGRGELRGNRRRRGYLEGGFATLIDRLVARLARYPVRIRTSCEVHGVSPDRGATWTLATTDGRTSFDRVVFAVSRNRELSESRRSETSASAVPRVVVQIGLALSSRLTPFLETFIVPSGRSVKRACVRSVVEMTNLIEAKYETGGDALVFVPLVVAANDPLVTAPHDDVVKTLLDAGVRPLFPGFDAASIRASRVDNFPLAPDGRRERTASCPGDLRRVTPGLFAPFRSCGAGIVSPEARVATAQRLARSLADGTGPAPGARFERRRLFLDRAPRGT